MTGPGEEGLFLDLRARGTAGEIEKLFPPPSYFTAYVDGALIQDKAGLLDALAAAFKFPSYFGKNWDALLDCLRSLPDEIPAEGYVLAVRNSRAFLSSSPRDREDFADIAGEARSFLKAKFKAVFVVVLL
ncbi:MAG: barstar family protein [Elusimicrobiota bacterium]|nr:barstar family protein [Elusimicrobiota bacterium]